MLQLETKWTVCVGYCLRYWYFTKWFLCTQTGEIHVEILSDNTIQHNDGYLEYCRYYVCNIKSFTTFLREERIIHTHMSRVLHYLLYSELDIPDQYITL